MGLFDDAGIDAAELAVNKLKKDVYPGVLSKVEVKLSTNPDKRTGQQEPYIVFSYTLPVWEWPIQDWFRILPAGKSIAQCDDTDDSYNVYQTKNGTVRQTEKAFFQAAYRQLKRRLMDLGVPEDQVNKVNPMDLVNTPVMLSIDESPKNDFPVLSKVSVQGASGTALPGTGAVPTIPGFPSANASPAPAVNAQGASVPSPGPAQVAPEPAVPTTAPTAPTAALPVLPNPFGTPTV